ncbi:alpha/beta hydrolase-fold protein [Sediminibacterium ginsengisoli]|uniref:Predicted hydrolase of the alpha/beta superfamily n=1 Tax=Sediminibacterium ginsengisoli TaxID=413434 RepID=A0A1T4LGQ0_9BACT|nr:alpha/beta hydrolase-fold protein [Sediminibacterium ginsengisoli]SJZ53905.1 Predicted hydrolase of the alpha/beta superfamily [Sediminibacterium ginsengisoli]
MKKIALLAALLVSAFAEAQFSVRLIVTQVATKAQEDIYVSGNFNNWNPKDENYKLKPFGGSRKSLVIKDMPAGTYAFRFTRGAADKMETTADGRDLADRVLEVNNDLSQEFTIAGWKDDYPEKPKPYTATPQVRVMDTAFAIPQLNRTRRIWVYLPKGYAGASKNYPVIYMQDGQDLFNEKTATAHEWGVDECMDTLQQKLNKEYIIVGIDNGGDKRQAEYDPAQPDGKAYAEFLVQTLKPYIDSKYRTRKAAENNYLCGSGSGAVISLYTALQYPAVFGGAGVFSPVFNNDLIYTIAEKFKPEQVAKFYFYTGSREPAAIPAGVQKLLNILQQKEKFVTRNVLNPLGQFSETYWRDEFDDFFKWL